MSLPSLWVLGASNDYWHGLFSCHLGFGTGINRQARVGGRFLNRGIEGEGGWQVVDHEIGNTVQEDFRANLILVRFVCAIVNKPFQREFESLLDGLPI